MTIMEAPHPDIVGQDDTSSIVSFEDISRKVVVRTKKPASKGVLKIDGKVPDVLHVIKYIGWNDKVVDSKSPLFLYSQSIQC